MQYCPYFKQTIRGGWRCYAGLGLGSEDAYCTGHQINGLTYKNCIHYKAAKKQGKKPPKNGTKL